jgi:hypothetical protein
MWLRGGSAALRNAATAPATSVTSIDTSDSRRRSSVTQEALVVPVDVLEPVRVVEYSGPQDLLDLLYRQIGCDHEDPTPELPSRYGSFVLWLDDVGLLKRPIEHNDRAIASCRAVGYDVADLAGTAVITGGATGAGDTRTIPPALRDRLLSTLQPLQVNPALIEAERRRVSTLGGRRTRDSSAADQPVHRDAGRAGPRQPRVAPRTQRVELG